MTNKIVLVETLNADRDSTDVIFVSDSVPFFSKNFGVQDILLSLLRGSLCKSWSCPAALFVWRRMMYARCVWYLCDLVCIFVCVGRIILYLVSASLRACLWCEYLTCPHKSMNVWKCACAHIHGTCVLYILYACTWTPAWMSGCAMCMWVLTCVLYRYLKACSVGWLQRYCWSALLFNASPSFLNEDCWFTNQERFSQYLVYSGRCRWKPIWVMLLNIEGVAGLVDWHS